MMSVSRKFNIEFYLCCEKTSCPSSTNAMFMYMSALYAVLCSILAHAYSVLRFSLMFSYVHCSRIMESPVALLSYLMKKYFSYMAQKYMNVNTFSQYVDIETLPLINAVHYLSCDHVHQEWRHEPDSNHDLDKNIVKGTSCFRMDFLRHLQLAMSAVYS